MSSPIVISPTDAALAIGAKCGGSSPGDEDPQLLALLEGLTPRLEAAMNVDSLCYGNYIDRFFLPVRPTKESEYSPRRVSVRLSNGYLAQGTLILRNEDGDILDPPKLINVDHVLGIVDFSDWERGWHSLEYVSGFSLPEEAETQVFIDLPEWMRPVVVLYLVAWYRTIFLVPKTPKDVSLNALMNGLQSELTARIYGKYQRPRANMIFADAR